MAAAQTPRTDGRTTVLLTGFGPFPSVPVNATMMLVPRLAEAATTLFPATCFVTAILPTEWTAAPRRVDGLLATHRPDLVVHFGVSSRARGFEIEIRGRNACALAPDATGQIPNGVHIDTTGPSLRPSRLPVAEIVRRLQRRGLPAFQSWNAGAYLCNATLYHVLEATHETTIESGFVHIPASLAPPGTQAARGGPLRTSPGCPLTWSQTLEGALEIVAACLDRPSPEMARLGRHSAVRSGMGLALA